MGGSRSVVYPNVLDLSTSTPAEEAVMADTNPTFVDPVCGMTVDPASAAGSSEYDGRTYWFCSAGCKQRFDADPAKYAASTPASVEDAHAGHQHAARGPGRTSAVTAHP